MKKFFTTFLIIIQCFSLFISSILAVIFYVCFDLNFYKDFYQKENIADYIDTSSDNLINNTQNLLNYLNKKEQLNTDWFSEKDILHMVDVQNLYTFSHNIMIYCFITFILSTIIIILNLRGKSLLYITKIFNKVLLLFIVLVGGLSAVIAYNFNSFWIKFHTTLFSNDLWLLSPNESNLIKMVPEEFFISLITKIIIYILILFILLFTSNIVIGKKLTK
ncbi:integral membrane protein [Gemella sanguinis M325]|uniref:TIGR01906 family membrane protein n=1 Tax=Gemella sanguinis TaxID=84135 RepID=A0ABX6FIP6_9BACL|nr:TIGR01906 family membrane protein [Gemella sanguinis]EGF89119.1 integral membrane protein [Gemella sanguinis M325]QGS07886.1 TIGR01906 family membrane protein [Gemella sanguinis]